MGSTETRYERPTKNVAVRHFNKGDFAEALKELRQLFSGADDTDVLVMQSICLYRLGDVDAIPQLRKHNGSRLTHHHTSLLLKHEVLGHIRFRRFDQAIALLEQQPLSKLEQDSLQLLNTALQVLREGQRTPIMRRRPERLGITTHREAKNIYLPRALADCDSAATWSASQSDDLGWLIHTLASYMMLVVELLMPSDTQNRILIGGLRRKLRDIDHDFGKSIPSAIRLVKFNHEF